ncbi:hypothetical protein FRC10_012126 [Ceratobasidium sp. 414]|nr:hypothetical protein FRC10_012126 [Ceratobasidium sp. 414]
MARFLLNLRVRTIIPYYLGGYSFTEEDLRPVAQHFGVNYSTRGRDIGTLLGLLEKHLKCSIFEVIGQPNYFFLVTRLSRNESDLPFEEKDREQTMLAEAAQRSLRCGVFLSLAKPDVLT